MDVPGSDGDERGRLERLLLAALGAAAVTGERAEGLVGELVGRGAERRAGGRGGLDVTKLARELGLVSREELEELQLRLAQVEHRLRLLEGSPAQASTRS